jgi:hypothetical protein
LPGSLLGSGAFDDNSSGEIGHEMRIRFIEFENGTETLDGTAKGRASDGTGEFEMGG